MINIIEEIDNIKKVIKIENIGMSIGELVSMYESGEIVLRPEYQRGLVWEEKQKTILIESLLIGLPIPSIFVASDNNGYWEVVDGLQRLSTIFDYIIGLNPRDAGTTRFDRLSGDLIYLKEQLSFEELPFKIKLSLKRQRINVVILQKETSKQVKLELFKRINQIY